MRNLAAAGASARRFAHVGFPEKLRGSVDHRAGSDRRGSGCSLAGAIAISDNQSRASNCSASATVRDVLSYGPPAAATVSDSFTRSDSTTSLGTSDTGQTWSAAGGTWGISQGQAYSTDDWLQTAMIESGVSDATAKATATKYSWNWGLVGRASDSANYMLLRVTGIAPGVTMELMRVQDYTFTSIASASATIADGDVVRLVG